MRHWVDGNAASTVLVVLVLWLAVLVLGVVLRSLARACTTSAAVAEVDEVADAFLFLSVFCALLYFCALYWNAFFSASSVFSEANRLRSWRNDAFSHAPVICTCLFLTFSCLFSFLVVILDHLLTRPSRLTRACRPPVG